MQGIALTQISGAATTFPVPQIGSAVIRFSDGETGTFSYTWESVSQTKPIQRFVVLAADQAQPIGVSE